MGASQITTRFGATVRSLRRRLGISQEMLAHRADLHRTYVAEVESGKRNISLKNIEKLARALQVTLDALFVPDGELAGTVKHPNSEADNSKLSAAKAAGETPG